MDLPIGAQSVLIDFTEYLLFDTPIQEAFCSINAGEFVGHTVDLQQKPNRSITVVLSHALQSKVGQVTCTVDQSQRTQPGH